MINTSVQIYKNFKYCTIDWMYSVKNICRDWRLHPSPAHESPLVFVFHPVWKIDLKIEIQDGLVFGTILGFDKKKSCPNNPCDSFHLSVLSDKDKHHMESITEKHVPVREFLVAPSLRLGTPLILYLGVVSCSTTDMQKWMGKIGP